MIEMLKKNSAEKERSYIRSICPLKSPGQDHKSEASSKNTCGITCLIFSI